jgi:hypothetical protein
MTFPALYSTRYISIHLYVPPRSWGWSGFSRLRAHAGAQLAHTASGMNRVKALFPRLVQPHQPNRRPVTSVHSHNTNHPIQHSTVQYCRNQIHYCIVTATDQISIDPHSTSINNKWTACHAMSCPTAQAQPTTL